MALVAERSDRSCWKDRENRNLNNKTTMENSKENPKNKQQKPTMWSECVT